MIKVSIKFSIEDYMKINYHFYYRRWTSKVTIAFGVLIVFFPVILLIKNDYFPWFLIFPGLFLLLVPLAEIYFKSKRNYKSDLLIGETIEYQFDN